MDLIKLATVRQHTRRELTVAEARGLVISANLSVLKAQAAALSLHRWLNTPEEWLQLEACLVLIEARRRNPGSRHKTGSCQLLVIGPQKSPHQVGESPFSLGAGSGRDPARNLEPLALPNADPPDPGF